MARPPRVVAIPTDGRGGRPPAGNPFGNCRAVDVCIGERRLVPGVYMAALAGPHRADVSARFYRRARRAHSRHSAAYIRRRRGPVRPAGGPCRRKRSLPRFWRRRVSLIAGFLLFGWAVVSLMPSLGFSIDVARLMALVCGLGMLAVAIEIVWRRPGRTTSVLSQSLLTLYLIALWLAWVAGLLGLLWLGLYALLLPAAVRGVGNVAQALAGSARAQRRPRRCDECAHRQRRQSGRRSRPQSRGSPISGASGRPRWPAARPARLMRIRAAQWHHHSPGGRPDLAIVESIDRLPDRACANRGRHRR